MKTKTALNSIINEIDVATASDVGVRTSGGDISIDPPEVIIDWQATALPELNGANTHGGFITDQSGNEIERETHQYQRIEADCLVRSQSELEAHNIADTIQETFAPYEYDATDFNQDTAEWDVGSASPRNNPVVEPDWYEIGVLLAFTTMKRATQSGDTLETINTEDSDDYIDISLEDGDVTIG